MTRRSPIPFLLTCAALGIACNSEEVVEPERERPPSITFKLEVTPTGASILQGGSASVAATITRSGGSIGTVNLTVTGLPTGVNAVVSNLESGGLVTTATLTFNVSGSTIPGDYGLVVHGPGPGITETTAEFALTVQEIPPCPGTAVCEQWGLSATASSEWSSTEWGANQATGQPNVTGCIDDGRAWASLESNGMEWLELSYRESVHPTEIRIHEVFGASSLVKVEVKDVAGGYHTVYSAQPASQACPRILTIPVSGVSEMVKVVRLSFDQRTLNNWNEIDAVKLIGITSAAGQFAGVYDLTAPVTSFDPAWGDLTGCRYTAVLTIQQNNRDSFEGTYADLQFICPGDSSDWEYSGFVKGSLDLEGRVIIELVGGNHTWTSWHGEGKLVSREISGKFGCCGHISGTFTVVRRQAQ